MEPLEEEEQLLVGLNCAIVDERIRNKLFKVIDVADRIRFFSEYWSYFKKIEGPDGTLLQKFSYCGTCKEVIQHKTGGTTDLKRHLEKAKCSDKFENVGRASRSRLADNQINARRRLDFGFSTFREVSSTIGSTASVPDGATALKPDEKVIIKKEITQAIVKLVAKDMRPFNVASSEQFISLAQLYLNIGASRGFVDVREITPSERTISANITDSYESLLKQILPEVINAAEEGKL